MTDITALNQFLADVEKRAFKMALFKVKDENEAMDIVQDTMMTLVRKYADKPQSEWTPLFYRILHNRVNDWYRRSYLRAKIFSVFQSAPMDEEVADPIQNAVDGYSVEPDFRLSMLNASKKLGQLLEHLPDRQREAFLLRTWEGLSVAETALAMQCSQGSVKTHYSRAVHKLREELKEDW